MLHSILLAGRDKTFGQTLVELPLARSILRAIWVRSQKWQYPRVHEDVRGDRPDAVTIQQQDKH